MLSHPEVDRADPPWQRAQRCARRTTPAERKPDLSLRDGCPRTRGAPRIKRACHRALLWLATLWLMAAPAFAQSAGALVRGRVSDETGGALPGVTVELRPQAGAPAVTGTDAGGNYAFSGVAPCTCQLPFSLINFAATTQRGLNVAA